MAVKSGGVLPGSLQSLCHAHPCPINREAVTASLSPDGTQMTEVQSTKNRQCFRPCVLRQETKLSHPDLSMAELQWGDTSLPGPWVCHLGVQSLEPAEPRAL